MIGINVKITEVGQPGRKPTDVKAFIDRRMKKLLKKLEQYLKGKVKVHSVTNRLASSVGFIQSQYNRGIVNYGLKKDVLYATFFESGTKRGYKSQPPSHRGSDLQRWVARKLGTNDIGVAFAVARSIKKKGTKGKHLLKELTARTNSFAAKVFK